MANLTPGGFFTRWVIALVMVLGTFNPTPYSYVTWVLLNPRDDVPAKVVVGVLLLIGYVLYFRAARESMGYGGMALAAAFFVAIIWLLNSVGLLDPSEPELVLWIVLIVLATIMAIGMSWSFIRRKISGQVDQV